MNKNAKTNADMVKSLQLPLFSCAKEFETFSDINFGSSARSLLKNRSSEIGK